MRHKSKVLMKSVSGKQSAADSKTDEKNPTKICRKFWVQREWEISNICIVSKFWPRFFPSHKTKQGSSIFLILVLEKLWFENLTELLNLVELKKTESEDH